MKIPDNKYLGSLCKRGHDYKGTGKSLRRRVNSECYECHMTNKKTYRKTEKYKTTTIEYNQRKDVKKRKNDWAKEKYKVPEYREKLKLDARTRGSEYRKRPSVVKRVAEWEKKYRKKPDVKARHKIANHKWSLKLTDAYVRAHIIYKSPLTRKDVSQGLIDSYRICIIADRAVRAADVALKQHKEKVS